MYEIYVIRIYIVNVVKYLYFTVICQGLVVFV